MTDDNSACLYRVLSAKTPPLLHVFFCEQVQIAPCNANHLKDWENLTFHSLLRLHTAPFVHTFCDGVTNISLTVHLQPGSYLRKEPRVGESSVSSSDVVEQVGRGHSGLLAQWLITDSTSVWIPTLGLPSYLRPQVLHPRLGDGHKMIV